MVNVKQGTGKAFKLSLDPKTSQFHFKVGANKIPAYPIMNAMGITDDNLEQAWGKEILNKNKSVNIQRSLNTAYKQFFNKQVNDV